MCSQKIDALPTELHLMTLVTRISVNHVFLVHKSLHQLSPFDHRNRQRRQSCFCGHKTSQTGKEAFTFSWSKGVASSLGHNKSTQVLCQSCRRIHKVLKSTEFSWTSQKTKPSLSMMQTKLLRLGKNMLLQPVASYTNTFDYQEQRVSIRNLKDTLIPFLFNFGRSSVAQSFSLSVTKTTG